MVDSHLLFNGEVGELRNHLNSIDISDTGYSEFVGPRKKKGKQCHYTKF